MKRIPAVSAALLATVLLAACEGDTEPLPEVTGRLDLVSHKPSKPAVTVPDTRQVPTFTQQCQTKTRTSTVNGKTTVSTYQDCKKVRTGTRTESYNRTITAAKPARWCAMVDGVWYSVPANVHAELLGKDLGTKVKGVQYLEMGC